MIWPRQYAARMVALQGEARERYLLTVPEYIRGWVEHLVLDEEAKRANLVPKKKKVLRVTRNYVSSGALWERGIDGNWRCRSVGHESLLWMLDTPAENMQDELIKRGYNYAWDE